MSVSERRRSAAFYQVYVRSFADPTVTARRPAGHHLAPAVPRDLGVDALWLTPFYRSPQHDHGYDVADYVDVDPRFGALDDVDALSRPRTSSG